LNAWKVPHDATSSLFGAQGMFRNFGATFVPFFRPYLEKLAVDSQVSYCGYSCSTFFTDALYLYMSCVCK